ncbi:MAG TPA: GAF domain-containing protein [Gemmatimonadaceae bacterium]|nr:GAF domain-containing protein [Gemmatimonadaceae bacterium]
MSGPSTREPTSQPFAPLDGTLAASLERAARLAATALRAPAAVLALVGDDRRCFVGGVEPPDWLAHDPGLLFRSGVCDRALDDGTPVIVDDTKEGKQLGPNVGAYAVVPLAADDGHPIGIFCVVDAVPREWSASDIAVLTEHAAAAATDLALPPTRAPGARRASPTPRGAPRCTDRPAQPPALHGATRPRRSPV